MGTHPLRATQDLFDAEGPEFLLDEHRLQEPGDWPPSIAMVCSDTESLGSQRSSCNRNYLFKDGMHVCPETLASRYGAGVACLVGCAYNVREKIGNRRANNVEHHNEQLDLKIRACEKECNEQFMSVMPVDDSWVDTNTTLHASVN